MRLHHRDHGYVDGGYACADCDNDCSACLFYRHPSRHGAPGDPFDFPCSQTFRDFYADPNGPVYRDPEDSIDDRIRRAVRDELAARDAAAHNRQRHDRALFGPEPPPAQEEPPEMPPPEELTRTPAQTPHTPKADKPAYRGIEIE